MNVINKLIDEYNLKGYELKVIKETSKSILFNLIEKSSGRVEDMEILKSFITLDNYDIIKNGFDYLISHNEKDLKYEVI